MADVHRSMHLLCTLCPKTPRFSDISHLLTHMSSKSHLAHRFKIQIRAQTEIAARKQLNDFDIWYHNNNLDALLADRLATKEQKKTKEKMQRPSKIYKKHAKKEKVPEVEEVLRKTPVYRASVPRMHLWPTEYSSGPNPMTNWEHSPIYSTPTARRPVPGTLLYDTPAGAMIDPSISTPWRPDGNDGSDQKLPDSAKLKGIYWPGMDLFDSATPEMKKKRNQRKDGALLEMLMAKSAQIEPNEVSYLPGGEFRASRNIFGPLSTESSPEKFAAPSPKKRKPRKVLANVSINAPRLRLSRVKRVSSLKTSLRSPAKRPFVHARQASSTVPGMSRQQHMPSFNPLAGFNQAYVPVADEDVEFKMVVGGNGRKQTFDIFRDQPERSPARTESPLEEHRFDFLQSNFPVLASNNNHRSLVSPTPLPKPTIVRALGNENRNDPSELSSRFQARRTISTPNVVPAQVFYESTFNPLYNQMYARSQGYADHQFDSYSNSSASTSHTSTFHRNLKIFSTDPLAHIPRSSMPSTVSSKEVNVNAQFNI